MYKALLVCTLHVPKKTCTGYACTHIHVHIYSYASEYFYFYVLRHWHIIGGFLYMLAVQGPSLKFCIFLHLLERVLIHITFTFVWCSNNYTCTPWQIAIHVCVMWAYLCIQTYISLWLLLVQAFMHIHHHLCMYMYTHKHKSYTYTHKITVPHTCIRMHTYLLQKTIRTRLHLHTYKRTSYMQTTCKQAYTIHANNIHTSIHYTCKQAYTIHANNIHTSIH
jgi:hypothetical protein